MDRWLSKFKSTEVSFSSSTIIEKESDPLTNSVNFKRENSPSNKQSASKKRKYDKS